MRARRGFAPGTRPIQPPFVESLAALIALRQTEGKGAQAAANDRL
jgi:hypothetical protein